MLSCHILCSSITVFTSHPLYHTAATFPSADSHIHTRPNVCNSYLLADCLSGWQACLFIWLQQSGKSGKARVSDYVHSNAHDIHSVCICAYLRAYILIERENCDRGARRGSLSICSFELRQMLWWSWLRAMVITSDTAAGICLIRCEIAMGTSVGGLRGKKWQKGRKCKENRKITYIIFLNRGIYLGIPL